MSKEKIGRNILDARKRLGITQEELAARTGYKTRSAINKIELGVRDLPQNKIVVFAQALGMTPGQLMGWDKQITTPEIHEKNELAVDILKRLGSDKDFAETVKLLYKMDAEQLRNVKNMLAGFVQ